MFGSIECKKEDLIACNIVHEYGVIMNSLCFLSNGYGMAMEATMFDKS